MNKNSRKSTPSWSGFQILWVMPFNSQVISLGLLHFFLPWHRRTALSGPSAEKCTGCRPRCKESTHCMAQGKKGGQCVPHLLQEPRQWPILPLVVGQVLQLLNPAELIPKSMELFSRQKELLFLSLFPLAMVPGTQAEGMTLSSLLDLRSLLLKLIWEWHRHILARKSSTMGLTFSSYTKSKSVRKFTARCSL